MLANNRRYANESSTVCFDDDSHRNLVFFGSIDSTGKASSVGAIGESEALNMAQQWALLVSQADIAGLEQLLSDRYVHIHGTALVESKGQFVAALKNGTRKYDPIKIEEANVRVFGDSAVVTGKFDLKAYTRGKTIESINRFGRAFKWISGPNQILEDQNEQRYCAGQVEPDQGGRREEDLWQAH